MRSASHAAADSDSPGAKRSRLDSGKNVAPKPCISVLMPCRNAMPWLPDCVASVLAQRSLEQDGGLELIVVDDSSTDGSLEWLRECAAALEEANQATETEKSPGTKQVESTSETNPFPLDRYAWEPAKLVPPTIQQVVAGTQPNNTLKFLTINTYGPSGQGLALNTAFQHARANLIGEMESDDLRPPHAFSVLKQTLQENKTWDCVTSAIRLIGWDRPGMSRWIEWQNSLDTPQKMRSGRFLEIPALRGSGLYTRRALEKMTSDSEFKYPYRDLWVMDGRVQDCAHRQDPDYRLEARVDERPRGWWPVDADFWQRWFSAGKVLTAGKVTAPLYLWRQYPAQSTRTHDRCSLARLRKCKAHFLVAPGGPCFGRTVQVWGTGDTLEHWVSDLQEALCDQLTRDENAVSGEEIEIVNELAATGVTPIRAVEYKPGAPVGEKQRKDEDAASKDAAQKFTFMLKCTGIDCRDDKSNAKPPVRLFAFGMEKARQKVAKTFKGFDEQSGDFWFVA